MRATRVVVPLAVIVAACGLGLEGTGPDPSTPLSFEGGAGDDAGSDAATPGFCERARAADPTVRFCADFDDPSATAPFGFTVEDTVPTGAFGLGPSPFPGEARSGAVQVDLVDGSGSRTQRLRAKVVDFPRSVTTRIIADVDVMVASTSTLGYFVIADLEALGQGCATDYRVAVQPDGMHVGATVVPVKPETAVHVRLTSEIVRGKTSTFSATIGDTSVANKGIFVGDACDTGWFDVGAFFTSTENAHASVRFDHVVVRVM